MVKYGLYVRLQPKAGKEKEIVEFLTSARPLVEAEPETVAWFAIDEDSSVYSIFDVFETEAARDKHLNGKVAATLKEKASELFSTPPQINKVNIVASKL